MSDQEGAPGPMERAYAEAETVLTDEQARAERRARVLGAVASEAHLPDVSVTPLIRRRRLGSSSGWLVAASVAAVSLLLVQLYEPAEIRLPPAEPAQQAPAAPGAAASLPPPSDAQPAPATVAPAIPEVVQRAETRSAEGEPAAPAAPPPSIERALPMSPPPAAAPPPAERHSAEASGAAATGSVAAPPPAARSALARAPSAEVTAQASASPDVLAARLRAAAMAGRLPEITALLAQGVAVDAADEDGETALIKAVRANHPAAANLLRRRGADPDARNHAGESARDLAASTGDPELARAVGLRR